MPVPCSGFPWSRPSVSGSPLAVWHCRALMNIKNVIEQRQCTGVWSHQNELLAQVSLSHGAEPSRWETHHILIPALEGTLFKRVFTHAPCSVSQGWLSSMDVGSFLSNYLSATPGKGQRGRGTTWTRQLAPWLEGQGDNGLCPPAYICH